MWETLLKLSASAFDFAKGTKRNTAEIEKTNQRVDELSNVLMTVLLKLDSLEKMEAKERQILILQLKNILLENGIKPPQTFDSPLLLPDPDEPKAPQP